MAELQHFLPITKDDFVREVIDRASLESIPVSPKIAEHFAERFFQFVPYSEMLGRQSESLVASAVLMLEHLAIYNGPAPEIAVLGSKESGPRHSVVAVLQPDSPFLVDSIRMEMTRQKLPVRSIVSVILETERDAAGSLLDVHHGVAGRQGTKEAVICVETDPVGSAEAGITIPEAIGEALDYVRLSVADFPAMHQRALAEAEYLKGDHPPLDSGEVDEARAFLEWMAADHFVFLGFDEHRIIEQDGRRILTPVEGSALGTMKRHLQLRNWVLEDLPDPARQFVEAPQILTFVNATHRSRVHRPVYPDYITVKRFDADGTLISACRFLGLFTSSVYNELPDEIPIVRQKVFQVLKNSGFEPGGHYSKSLIGVLNAYPRDELFQASESELFETAMGIVQVQESPRVRLFLRLNPYGRFCYCQVFLPKEIYDTELRKKIQELLCRRLGADDVGVTTKMGDSDLARLRFLLRVPESAAGEIDVRQLERELVEISRNWDDIFCERLRESRGEEDAGSLMRQYRGAFPASYRDHFDGDRALTDLDHLAELDQGAELSLRLEANPSGERLLSFRLFHRSEPVSISDVLPIVENMGLRAESEHPYRIERQDGVVFWIHDFGLVPAFPGPIDPKSAAERFREAFLAIWQGLAENDGFNALILGAGLTWREAAVLRAYARYNRQARFGFGLINTFETLGRHFEIAGLLIRFFQARFDPSIEDRESAGRPIEKTIHVALDSVPSLNEDQVLRRYLELMKATLRTNFFQADAAGASRPSLSFKLDPAGISGLPLPRPAYEIFVYSPRVEGIHLRGGRIARGGLRWSDRPEDFRTEVLGLAKAQQVKNAVIVPVGAKGGFVGRRLPQGDRTAVFEEGKECYRAFLRGLLDLTDNLVGGSIRPPEGVVRHDPDDPYLVVAADKGTASFSDIGNSISAEYGFWLGDAFASGGSEGYDHKKMGITARGAWISVQRHFCEMGVDVQSEDITVVGIGDMGGDVFGNGMLCSEHIQLVAAFNHLHILIDPNPDPARSFQERKRLFDAAAGWGDYDLSLLSEGGALYSREQKTIELSPQARERFQVGAEPMTPGELISALLRAPVDLLWNGGIGTFVKASSESHDDAGDRGNDGLRINAPELRCRVIGEGGNLGFTQRARVEYCLTGGACNTDFIDNSAGVDCSDHEVNLKIHLNQLEAAGEMNREDRNELLAGMTDAVAALVLHNNYRQTRAISLAEDQSLKRTVEYLRLLEHWERAGEIDREVEALPDNETLVERASRGKGLTRPELSVLIAYAKTMLKLGLVDSDVPEDPLMSQFVELAFPPQFVDHFRDQLAGHPLRREIVSTQWANDLVNHMGPSFIYRLEEATGAAPAEIARAYAAAREIFSMPERWKEIEGLDQQVDPKIQHRMMYELSRLVRRGSRWLVRNCRDELGDLPALVSRFRPGVQQVAHDLQALLHDAAQNYWEKRFREFSEAGVPRELAAATASCSGIYSSLGVIYSSEQTGTPVDLAARVYFSASDALDLHWLSYRIRDLAVDDHWEARARETFRDELHIQQRRLTIRILREQPDGDPASRLRSWLDQRRHFADRWRKVLEEFRAAGSRDYATYSVVLRELAVLVEKS